MANNSFLNSIWMFLLPMIAIMIPIWLGQRYGTFVKKKSPDIQEGPIGTAVGSSLGLLAFMLAFTFQIVSNRFDTRKELLLNEVMDIRTTYLYSGLIPEPLRSAARKQLVTYVDVRVELTRDPSKLNYSISRSQQILDSLWSYSETLAAQDRSSEAYSLFITSVGSLVSLFNERITVSLQYHIPTAILYLLGFITFFSMLTFGYQFGISGTINFPVIVLLAINFAAVIWLIFALDYPTARLIPLNQAPLYTLHEQLHKMQ